jgi:hypothetical protein
MRRLALPIATLTICSLATFGLGYRFAQPLPNLASTGWSTGPTITSLESLGELVSTKVQVADVLEATGNDYRGSWLIKGDALISIEMTRARIVESNDRTHAARVSLPLPKVLSARVDHSRTKTWSVEKTTWIPLRGNPDSMRDDAMKHAQELVEYAANSKENMDHAKYSAETVIENIYRLVGWQVTIEWEKPTL